MADAILIANSIPIRDAQLDEYWLQDQIIEKPACLGLGDLEVLTRERRQSSGGKIDILLKNPEDDSMYEVEVMLGETDESHIIRTIEYWDNEKRKFPKRSHTAVLVAEHINRRFFNVIQLLSYSIPIIAVQAALIEVSGTRTLFFSKVLDTFEEIEDGTPLAEITYTRDDWLRKSPWTVDTADYLLNLTTEPFGSPTLNYVKNYVAITVDGHNYLTLHHRTKPKSLLWLRMGDVLQDETVALLDSGNIAYVRKPNSFRVTVDKTMIQTNPTLFKSLAGLVKRAWAS